MRSLSHIRSLTIWNFITTLAISASVAIWPSGIGVAISRGAFALSPSYDVRRYGAKGDGASNDTRALQSAIDAAAGRGGGLVLLPPGSYLSGTIHLRSRVTLRLSRGATLVASTRDTDFDPYESPPPGSISSAEVTWTFENPRKKSINSASSDLLPRTVDNPDTTYSHYSLIVGDGVSDVSIDGFGTIDGNRTQKRRSKADRAQELPPRRHRRRPRRPSCGESSATSVLTIIAPT